MHKVHTCLNQIRFFVPYFFVINSTSKCRSLNLTFFFKCQINYAVYFLVKFRAICTETLSNNLFNFMLRYMTAVGYCSTPTNPL